MKTTGYIPSVNLQDDPDEALIAVLARGGYPAREAFTVLVRRHTQVFHRLAYRLLNDSAEAEDVVQHCFIKLWERPGIFNPDRNARFTTWFYRVVSNRALDVRNARRMVPMPENFDAPSNDLAQDAAMEQEAEQASVRDAFATLPPRQQQALALCYDQGLSNQEAADVMGLTLKAVQGLISRGKDQLRKKLGQTENKRRAQYAA